MSACISAVQHIRRLRGGAQSQLVRASDGRYYVTKLMQNPQHVRVLANEMLATRLGELLGLPVPRVIAIDICEWLIEHSGELRIDLAGTQVAPKAGLHLGSAYVVDPPDGDLFDYLPETLLCQVENISDVARSLVLDKWTCNADGRQVVFSRPGGRKPVFHATLIDQGYCFNAGEWTFPDYALRGVYARNCVYAHVKGWDAFEPALTRAEEMDLAAIWRIAASIPTEWYEHDRAGLDRLVEQLYSRRSQIRDLISAFRTSSRNPFPLWTTA